MNQILMNHQFRELIRCVRACKTGNEERTLVARECATIRNVFKEENSPDRCLAMTKLLYFYILGYPAHFGQMECLKLISSNKFCEKRIGYLGCMLLLDENSDVHLLITNCLKNDLTNTSRYVQSIALCTLASICSVDMAKNLYVWVLNLLESGSNYVMKKASLCACRIVSKCPELINVFIPSIKRLLSTKQQSLYMTSCTLAITILEIDECKFKEIEQLKIYDELYKILRNLVINGSPAEYKVRGVSNPFLQIKILRLLSYYGRNNQNLPIQLGELLAQIITTSEKSVYANKAIMYEAVCTIMKTNSFKELRVMGINLMGHFLKSTDKNVIYAALSLMLQISSTDKIYILRHREEIFKCITDRDPSICKSAIELIFLLVDQNNLIDTVERLLQFLYVCDESFKQYLTSNIVTCLEKYLSNDEWNFLTFIELLETASSYMRDDSVSNFIAMLSNTPSMQNIVVLHLVNSLKIDITRPVLNHVACWCIGEYGYLAVTGDNNTLSHEMINLLKNILDSSFTDNISKYYAIYALMKLSTKIDHIKHLCDAIIFKYMSHIDVELQQRSSEWNVIIKSNNTLHHTLFSPMPPLQIHNQQFNQQISNKSSSNLTLDNTTHQSTTAPTTQDALSVANSLIDDILQLNNTQITQNEKYNVKFYDKNSINASITFNDPSSDGTLNTTLIINNHSSVTVNDVICQIAVPKNITIKILPPNTNELSPNQQYFQQLIFTNPNKVPLKFKARLEYYINATTHIQDTILVDNFPVFSY